MLLLVDSFWFRLVLFCFWLTEFTVRLAALVDLNDRLAGRLVNLTVGHFGVGGFKEATASAGVETTHRANAMSFDAIHSFIHLLLLFLLTANAFSPLIHIDPCI